jgi:hypothetical protein
VLYDRRLFGGSVRNFIHAVDPGPGYLVGLIPLLIGVALLVYAYSLTAEV